MRKTLTLLIAAICVITAVTPAAWANGSGNALDIFTDRDEKGLDARVVRLGDGRLIATYPHWIERAGGTPVPWRFRESRDDGRTWTTLSELTAPNTPATWNIKFGLALLELPQAAGRFPKGTLVFIGSVHNWNNPVDSTFGSGLAGVRDFGGAASFRNFTAG